MGAATVRTPRRLAAIVFDFDGLILDTETAEYRSIAEVFVDHGTEFPLDVWRTFLGTTDHPHWTEVLAERVGPDVDLAAARSARRARNRAMVAELEAMPGIVELLDAARSANLPVAVASSSPRDWVESHLERIGLAARFEVICTRDDVERGKPDPMLFRLAVESLGVEPGRAVAIEDSLHGCAAARGAGLLVVAIPSPFLDHLDFSIADLVVASASSLDLAVLDELVGEGP
jgi:HAD superfamily hydrolase (TIGR01509 family)